MSEIKKKYILKVMLNGPKNNNDKHIYKFQYDEKAIKTIMTSFLDNKYPFIFLRTYINIRKYFSSCGKTLKQESECVQNHNNYDDDEDSIIYYNDECDDKIISSYTFQEVVQ